jgi:hypothetical protein
MVGILLCANEFSQDFHAAYVNAIVIQVCTQVIVSTSLGSIATTALYVAT